MECCEYCNAPMAEVSEHHDYWGAPLDEEYTECQNDLCPGETVDCEECGKALEFDETEFLPCECQHRAPAFAAKLKGWQLRDVFRHTILRALPSKGAA